MLRHWHCSASHARARVHTCACARKRTHAHMQAWTHPGVCLVRGLPACGLQGIEELQDDLDAELAAMQRQLEAIRAESAAVTARKAHLELELLKLLQVGGPAGPSLRPYPAGTGTGLSAWRCIAHAQMLAAAPAGIGSRGDCGSPWGG